MRKKTLVVVVVATALVMVAPAAATASTATPALTSGATQAFIANAANVPQAGSTSLSNAMVIAGAANINCSSYTMGVSYTTAGTATITSFSASGCSMPSFPGCTVSIVPTGGSLPWGARLQHTSATGFVLHVNMAYTKILSPGTPTCPAPAGAYPDTGLLQAHAFVSASALSAGYDAGSGSLTGPLGASTLSGTISGTLPAGSTKLI